MRTNVRFAIACGTIAAAVFAGEPASASNAWGGSYCLSYRDGGADCGFTSLAQCQASASGTDAGCYAAPQAVLKQQQSYAMEVAPTPARRATRVRRSH